MVGGAELLATTEWKSWWVGWRAARCATHTFTTLPTAQFSSASASTTWKLGHRPLQDSPLWQELLTMMLTFQQIFPFSGSSYIGHKLRILRLFSTYIDRGFKPKLAKIGTPSKAGYDDRSQPYLSFCVSGRSKERAGQVSQR